MRRLFTHVSFIGFLFMTCMAYSQYVFDGNYSPCDTTGDEYANAYVPDTQPEAGSSTCNVRKTFADTYQENGVDYFILGVQHGNGGQSTFRIYVNTDCDETTGQINAAQNFGGSPQNIPVYGAEFMVLVTTKNNPTVSVYEWDGTDMVTSANGAAKTGAYTCSDAGGGDSGAFFEVRVPVSSSNGGVFDPCDNNSCGTLELSTIISNAGGSPNSSYCDDVELLLPIPVNEPPVPDFTVSQTCDPTAPEVPGGGQLPKVCLAPKGFIDANFDIGDQITYEWKYYINGIEGSNGTFDNQTNTGGTPITGSTINDMATCFTPAASELPNTFTFELTLTDQYNCGVQSQESSTEYSIDLSVLTSIQCSILPIQLTSFSGEYINDKEVELKWNTASEIDNERFEIQRKYDFENEFRTIYELPGAGDSQEPTDYSFIDQSAGYGSAFYRLMQVDFNGDSYYSNIIELKKEVVENKAALYTTGEEFIVEIETANNNYARQIEVFNVFGQRIDVVELDSNQKLTQQYFSTEAYARGMFFVNITFDNGQNQVLKSMK